MEKRFQIKKGSFPKQSESDVVKKTKEYGNKVGNAILGDWFYRSKGNCRYYDFKNEIIRRRLYARGEQSVDKYKSEFSQNGSLSYLNLNWTPVPIIPKFSDIVANGMYGRDFYIKASSIDPTSSSEKIKFKETIEADMMSRDFLEQASEIGINAFNVDPEKLPTSGDELNVFMELEYKPRIEIAVELSVDSVLKDNDYKDIVKPMLDRDAIQVGMAVAKHEFDPNRGVNIDYVDPENFIWSHTDDPYFRDCIYFGEVKRINVSEVHRMYPNLTKDQLEEISKSGNQWDLYHQLTNVNESYSDYESFPDTKAALLYFNFKTTRNNVFKKKKLKNGGERILKKEDNFSPTDAIDYEKVLWIDEVWYEGVMVMGTDILLKWDIAKNMTRPKGNSNVVYPNYIVVAPKLYKGRIESLVSRMIPFADLIQLVHLKLQQVLKRMIPDGVFIDIDGINEIDLGNGQTYNPTEALNMYLQTGSVIGRSVTAEGEFNNGKVPIQELTSNGANNKIQSLIQSYNQYLQMIRDVTGLNEARDGSTPDKNALVGLQKMAAYNSNVATRHILDAGTYMTKKLSEAIVLRLSDAIEHHYTKKDLERRLGTDNLNILEDIRNIPLRDFSMDIELSPDEEQKERLEANIQQEMANGSLWIEDAIDIRGISNIKLANQLLKLKKKKRMEILQQQQRENIEMQTQSTIDSANATAQSKAELVKIESDAKMAINSNLVENEIRKMIEEAEKKKELMAIEFEYKKELLQMQIDLANGKETYKEDRKDKRLEKQSSHQSKLIDQRKNNKEPLNFEEEDGDNLFDDNREFSMENRKPKVPLQTFESSGNDTLGSGFDMESFAPK